MRLARVPAEIVAPTMSHRDTRMVERVYGRLSPEEIGALLTQDFAPACIAGASVSVDRPENMDGMDARAAPAPRKQCPGAESNHRHGDFQSPALPTELPGRDAPPHLTAAELLKRTFQTDVLTCPRCGGTRRVVAVVLRSTTAQAILEHLRLPSRPLPLAPATSPPQLGLW